jgi:hypothetical protein
MIHGINTIAAIFLFALPFFHADEASKHLMAAGN